MNANAPEAPSVFAPLLDFEGTTAENADWRPRLATPALRARAWANMLLLDHGIFRMIWKNRAEVSPRVWRSNQPSPADLAWAKSVGVRTVVSTRAGIEFGAYPLEREACETLGLAFRVFAFGSRTPPDVALMRAAPDFFAGLEYPILIHCKSGADRAGFLSALYLALMEGHDPLQAARAHLALRFGHVRSAKTGILDRVFEIYAADNARAPISFRDWLMRAYDPARILDGFKPRLISDLVASRLAGHE